MVSELWKASSEGDLARVNHLLLEATVADIEINGSFFSCSVLPRAPSTSKLY